MRKNIRTLCTALIMIIAISLLTQHVGEINQVYAGDISIQKETNRVFLKIGVITIASLLCGLGLGALLYYLNEKGKLNLGALENIKTKTIGKLKKSRFSVIVGVLMSIGFLMLFFFFLMYFYYIPNGINFSNNSDKDYTYEEAEEYDYGDEYCPPSAEIDLEGFWKLESIGNFKGIWFGSDDTFRLHENQISYREGAYEVNDDKVILDFTDEESDEEVDELVLTLKEVKDETVERKICSEEGVCYNESEDSLNSYEVCSLESLQDSIEDDAITEWSFDQVDEYGDQILKYELAGEICELNLTDYLADKLNKESEYEILDIVGIGRYEIAFSYSVAVSDSDESYIEDNTGLTKYDFETDEFDDLVLYTYGSINEITYLEADSDYENDAIIYRNEFYSSPTPHVQEACTEEKCEAIEEICDDEGCQTIEEVLTEKDRKTKESGDIGTYYYDLEENEITVINQPFN